MPHGCAAARENIAALLLAAMFVCFILQIVVRYVFNHSARLDR